jgi:hypothetical protein
MKYSLTGVQMDKVRTPECYYRVFDVNKDCSMEEFGSTNIKDFKIEFGYGYYEFKEAELIKPHKKVILVDKVSLKLRINIASI